MLPAREADQPVGLVAPAHDHDLTIRGAMDRHGPRNRAKQGRRPRSEGQDNLDRERSL